jgi:hypothetical protein
MDKSTITNLINALANQTAANSITPQSLANILHAINENTGNGGGGSSGGGSSLPLGLNWFFGHTCQLNTTAAVECPIVTDDTDCSSVTGSLIAVTTNDSDEPLVRGVSPCLVEITGYVTLKVNESYTADRIIQIYKYDTEGERTQIAMNAVHFTGTTQIFSVPINYMCFLDPGETVHLTHFSSNGTSNISANSTLYIKATPI